MAQLCHFYKSGFDKLLDRSIEIDDVLRLQYGNTHFNSQRKLDSCIHNVLLYLAYVQSLLLLVQRISEINKVCNWSKISISTLKFSVYEKLHMSNLGSVGGYLKMTCANSWALARLLLNMEYLDWLSRNAPEMRSSNNLYINSIDRDSFD